jgi:iron complex outermembrane receptor protein
VNAAAFYYDYKNIQVQEYFTGAINLVNAAAATMKGIDVDFAFLPIDSVTVRGGFEMMSGHYTNFRNAPFYSPTLGPSGAPVGGNTQSVGDATGFDTVRTPKGTATVSVAYRVPAPRGSLSFRRQRLLQQRFQLGPGRPSATVELRVGECLGRLECSQEWLERAAVGQ